jgi:hypothetical protein
VTRQNNYTNTKRKEKEGSRKKKGEKGSANKKLN